MSYSEADLVRELSRTWLSKSDRRWMEAELAKVRASGGAPSSPVQTATPRPQERAPQPSGDAIAIEGSPAFIAATEAALKRLQGTPSWSLVAGLHGIKQVSSDQIGNSEVGGYLKDGIFHVGDSTWRNDARHYASDIAHEGAHAAHPHAMGAEGEKIAFCAQVKALTELGAPRSVIGKYESYAQNPTHHINWNGPRY